MTTEYELHTQGASWNHNPPYDGNDPDRNKGLARAAPQKAEPSDAVSAAVAVGGRIVPALGDRGDPVLLYPDQLVALLARYGQPAASVGPVAWIRKNGFRFIADIEPKDDSEIPLYAAPVAAQAQPKRRPYNTSGSLSEYGIFPECDAAQASGQAQDAEVDPLQGAANWLATAINGCEARDLQNRLSIGHNRASRLLDAARAAGGEQLTSGREGE